MKRIRFTEEQIIWVLREAATGAKTADLARQHGVCALHVCVSRGYAVQLEGENGWLKRLLTNAMLENAGLKDLLS